VAFGVLLLDEVTVNKVQSNGVPVVVDLFGEPIGEPGKAAHVHTHGQVLPLDMAGRNELWIGLALDYGFLAAGAFGRAVFPFVILASRILIDTSAIREAARTLET
jgi:hypothetical protein